jgi:hypothetical protein
VRVKPSSPRRVLDTEVSGVALDGKWLQSPDRIVVKGATKARVVGFLVVHRGNDMDVV